MAKNKPTFTPKGRLKTCSMPFLWGKEWGVAKEIRDYLKEIATALNDLVEIERQKLETEQIRFK
jgi:hypothetical protein